MANSYQNQEKDDIESSVSNEEEPLKYGSLRSEGERVNYETNQDDFLLIDVRVSL